MQSVLALLALAALVALAADTPGLGPFAVGLLAVIFLAALLNSKASLSLIGKV